MSEITARHLQARGAPAVLVANRTYDKAVQLAGQFGGEARRFDDLPEALLVADIVICSTAAPHPVVTRPIIERAMRGRRNRPLYIIDIAVPRDVEESVDRLSNVYLSNIDDLQHLVASARQTRAAEVDRARALIEDAVTEYLKWWRSLEVSPLIVAVREKLAAVRLAELAKLRARLPGLSEKEWRAIEAGMEAVTNKVAHPAIMTIKQGAHATDSAAAFDTIRRAFGLDETEMAGEQSGDRSRAQPDAARAAQEVRGQ
jgi:glutamyl-tRNA reductase